MHPTIKALSLWEPWASLVSVGSKRYETRPWSTTYRGPLLICAAKRRDFKNLQLLNDPEFQTGLAPLLGEDRTPDMRVEIGDLRFGEAVAVVDLVDCIPTELLSRAALLKEVLFGDFGVERFAWKLDNVRPLPRGIEVKGKQGLFNVDTTAAIHGR